MRLPGRDRVPQGRLIHPGHHQNVAILGVLDDRRNEPFLVPFQGGQKRWKFTELATVIGILDQMIELTVSNVSVYQDRPRRTNPKRLTAARATIRRQALWQLRKSSSLPSSDWPQPDPPTRA